MKKIDLADVLLIAGLALLLVGIAHFSFALAEIVAGLFCLLFVVLIQRGRSNERKAGA